MDQGIWRVTEDRMNQIHIHIHIHVIVGTFFHHDVNCVVFYYLGRLESKLNIIARDISTDARIIVIGFNPIFGQFDFRATAW